MKSRIAILALAACLVAGAQTKLTVDQVVSFVKSSIRLKQKDGRVAKYLKHVQLTERLDPSTVEDLQGLGAGPKTIAALKRLSRASAGLKPGHPVVHKKLPPLPPPSPEEQQRILEQVREYAHNYTKNLPDFICTQVTRRYVDPSGLEFWHKIDTVLTKLTYFEQKENYKVVTINNQPVDIPYSQLQGSTSSGEFGSMMKEIFDPKSKTQFRWLRWGKLRGRLTYVYHYYVPKSTSKWTISYEHKLRTTPAYEGLIYVDKATNKVTRITLQATDIDPSFPVQEASTVLDYDYVKIAGREYLLPLKAEVRMREARTLVKNDVEFRMYRKFGAEAHISFQPPAPLPKEMTTEQPVNKKPAPKK